MDIQHRPENAISAMPNRIGASAACTGTAAGKGGDLSLDPHSTIMMRMFSRPCDAANRAGQEGAVRAMTWSLDQARARASGALLLLSAGHAAAADPDWPTPSARLNSAIDRQERITVTAPRLRFLPAPQPDVGLAQPDRPAAPRWRVGAVTIEGGQFQDHLSNGASMTASMPVRGLPGLDVVFNASASHDAISTGTAAAAAATVGFRLRF